MAIFSWIAYELWHFNIFVLLSQELKPKMKNKNMINY